MLDNIETPPREPEKRGLRATILRPWTALKPDPSRLISGNLDNWEVILVGPGIPELYPAWSGKPVVVLGETTPGYRVARPINPCPSDRHGYMASGAYIVQAGCYDEWFDVFGHRLPIPLHDFAERRREAWHD